MTASTSTVTLDPGPEADDPFVQAGVHAILEWLRGEIATATELVDTFGRPHGPLGPPLRFAGSLLHEPSEVPPVEPPRPLVVGSQAAYFRRWLELTRPPIKNASDHAG